MKKTALIVFLTLIFSLSVLAEGEIPIGGKSCPSGQTSCLVVENQPETKSEIPIYKKFTDFLKYLFG